MSDAIKLAIAALEQATEVDRLGIINAAKHGLLKKARESRDAALAALRAQPAGWMSIESAPKESKAKIVWCPARKNTFVASWRADDWYVFGAHDVMLLCTDTGRQATERMLLNRWNKAKKKAAEENPALTEALAGLYNRDMRSRAADLSDDLDSAAKLLQHGSKKITADHYRNKPEKLRAVR